MNSVDGNEMFRFPPSLNLNINARASTPREDSMMLDSSMIKPGKGMFSAIQIDNKKLEKGQKKPKKSINKFKREEVQSNKKLRRRGTV